MPQTRIPRRRFLIGLLLTASSAIAAPIDAPAPPRRSLSFDLEDDGAWTLHDSNGALIAQKPAGPWLSILFADTPYIWKAQTWREIQPDSMSIRHRGDGSMTLEIRSFGGVPVRVVMTGQVDEARDEIAWNIHLTNHSHGTVVGVNGPGLQGIEDREGGMLYFPDRPGQRLADPWRRLAAAPSRLVYPVPASMQYLTYAGESGGIALHVQDRAMVYKELIFGGPQREMSVTQYPFVATGKSWISPRVVWQALSGDWHAAARRYAAWFRSWAHHPEISPEVKAFPVMGGIVILSRPVDDANVRDVLKRQESGTYPAALKKALALKADGFQGAELIGWFGRGHDTTYPDFYPTALMGGKQEFLDLVNGMRGAGMLVTLYLNARLANIHNPTLLAHRDWEAQLPNGALRHETYGDQTFTALCPAAAGFQRQMEETVRRVAGEYHVDGPQLDQIGAASAVLCFNPSHGHRTPATAWSEGYMKMLPELQRTARQINPAFWTWVEGAWEGAGQYINASQGGFWKSIPDAETFPDLYRYTLPEHPLFGDPGMGGIPYWCPTDIHRAMRINRAAGDTFWRGRYMDNIGLSADPAAEVHWFLDRSRAVLTVRNNSAAAQTFTLTLSLPSRSNAGAYHGLREAERELTSLRRRGPKKAATLAAGEALTARIAGGRLVAPLSVPAGQVEAALIEW